MKNTMSFKGYKSVRALNNYYKYSEKVNYIIDRKFRFLYSR